ncbi:MAG: response regulator transcription factor [Micropruina sp.]|nr:response regulator transcription factor [Micropruina sp.]HBX81726.1 DNA-binding response regulator [Propionibacteriaceae bacterium]
MISVLLVDDDALVRTGLRLILGGNSGIQIVGEATDGEEALAAVHQLHPDVVLMDIRMPNRDGLWATAAINQLPDPPKIVALTTFDSDDLVLKALAAGAIGFLLKDTPPPRMVEAVRAAAAGEPTLSPSVAAKVIAAATRNVADDPRAAAKATLDVLAERELDVAIAIGRGLSNAEIAAELYMSVATVKAYATRVFTKLGVDNRTQVALRVRDAGLV